MNPLDHFVGGVLAPVLIVLIASAAARRPWRRLDDVHRGTWPGPLAVAVGYAVGIVALAGRAPTHGIGRDESWLIYGAALFGLLPILDRRMRWPVGLRWLIYTAFAIVIASLLVARLVRDELGLGWTIVLMAAAGGVSGLVIVLMQRLAEAWSQRGVMTAYLITAIGLTGLLFLGGSVMYGFNGRVVAAVIGGLWLISMWDGRAAFAVSVTPLFILLMCGWGLLEFFFIFHDPAVRLGIGDVGLTGRQLIALAMTLVLLAPCAAWAGQLGLVRRRGGAWSMVVALMAVTVVVGLAMGLAGIAMPDFG